MNAPVGIIRAAWDVQQKLSKEGFQFCFIGGLALQRWGEPRYTQDVDLSLLCPFGEEIATGRRLVTLLQPRIEEAVVFSAESRVFLARTNDGTPVDIAFGAIDFEVRCIGRSTVFDFGGGIHLRTCSAEDLIVMKAFANRERDWTDVEAVILRQGSWLDWEQIEYELKPLLEIRGGSAVWDRLVEMKPKT